MACLYKNKGVAFLQVFEDISGKSGYDSDKGHRNRFWTKVGLVWENFYFIQHVFECEFRILLRKREVSDCEVEQKPRRHGVHREPQSKSSKRKINCRGIY